MVVDGLGLSGKTRALVNLALGLDRQRFMPTVLSFDVDDVPLTNELRHHDIRVLREPLGVGLRPTRVWRMARLIRKIRPDVVHCYNPRAMLYGGAAAHLCGIKATLGTLSAFACLVPDREYSFLPQDLMTRTYRNRMRNRIIARLMRRLTVVSADLGAAFCSYNQIPVSSLCEVPYGVSLGEPPGSPSRSATRHRIRSELSLAEDHLVVMSVGRLVEQKDYPTQLRGFAEAARQESRLRMVLVGDGPLRARLEALVEELGVRSHVLFVGYRSDVGPLLQAADVFTLTSIFEPLGIAILEAKANGTPILAAAVNEIPRLLAAGHAGRLVAAGSSSDYATQLLDMVGNPATCASMAERAYAEARENHSLVAMIDAYQRLYDQILRRRISSTHGS